jgi:transposase
MTRPYSEDIRERALARADAGKRSFDCRGAPDQPSCVTKWKNLRRDTGGLSPGQIGGLKKRVLSDANADWLRKRTRSGPFTLRKLTQELAARGIKTDVRAVWTFVHTEGLSFKETLLPAEQDRPDVARRRTRWKAHQGRIDVARLVFIDETWIKTNMAPLRGWGPCGQRHLRPLEDNDLHRGAALRSDQRALGD